MYKEGAIYLKMMTIELHPRVIGEAGWAIGLDLFLAYVRSTLAYGLRTATILRSSKRENMHDQELE